MHYLGYCNLKIFILAAHIHILLVTWIGPICQLYFSTLFYWKNSRIQSYHFYLKHRFLKVPSSFPVVRFWSFNGIEERLLNEKDCDLSLCANLSMSAFNQQLILSANWWTHLNRFIRKYPWEHCDGIFSSLIVPSKPLWMLIVYVLRIEIILEITKL